MVDYRYEERCDECLVYVWYVNGAGWDHDSGSTKLPLFALDLSSAHFTSPHFTSLYLTLSSLYFTPLHLTLLHPTPLIDTRGGVKSELEGSRG